MKSSVKIKSTSKNITVNWIKRNGFLHLCSAFSAPVMSVAFPSDGGSCSAGPYLGNKIKEPVDRV